MKSLSAMAAARGGVLFKSSAAMDALARVNTIAFDKTGTLTQAKMTVARVVADDEVGATARAAGLESHSAHPIAQAVVTAARTQNTSFFPVRNAQAGMNPPEGFTVTFDDRSSHGHQHTLSQELK
ncbi:HAD family hydrolase [Deinococcus detaillensis]|nr:HAD family hydrolase [Deinococcus detaillensis]